MKINSWVIKFFLIAFCLKFLLTSLFVSFILSAILGFKLEDNDSSKSLIALVLGLFLGVESALLAVFTTPFDIFSQILSFVRGFGFQVIDPISYATFQVVTFAILLLVETLFVVVMTAFFTSLAKGLRAKGYAFLW